jgi:hypothetical protein
MKLNELRDKENDIREDERRAEVYVTLIESYQEKTTTMSDPDWITWLGASLKSDYNEPLRRALTHLRPQIMGMIIGLLEVKGRECELRATATREFLHVYGIEVAK